MSTIYEKKGRVAYFTFTSHEGLNVFDPEDISQLNGYLQDFMDDSDWKPVTAEAADG